MAVVVLHSELFWCMLLGCFFLSCDASPSSSSNSSLSMSISAAFLNASQSSWLDNASRSLDTPLVNASRSLDNASRSTNIQPLNATSERVVPTRTSATSSFSLSGSSPSGPSSSETPVPMKRPTKSLSPTPSTSDSPTASSRTAPTHSESMHPLRTLSDSLVVHTATQGVPPHEVGALAIAAAVLCGVAVLAAIVTEVPEAVVHLQLSISTVVYGGQCYCEDVQLSARDSVAMVSEVASWDASDGGQLLTTLATLLLLVSWHSGVVVILRLALQRFRKDVFGPSHYPSLPYSLAIAFYPSVALDSLRLLVGDSAPAWPMYIVAVAGLFLCASLLSAVFVWVGCFCNITYFENIEDVNAALSTNAAPVPLRPEIRNMAQFVYDVKQMFREAPRKMVHQRGVWDLSYSSVRSILGDWHAPTRRYFIVSPMLLSLGAAVVFNVSWVSCSTRFLLLALVHCCFGLCSVLLRVHSTDLVSAVEALSSTVSVLAVVTPIIPNSASSAKLPFCLLIVQAAVSGAWIASRSYFRWQAAQVPWKENYEALREKVINARFTAEDPGVDDTHPSELPPLLVAPSPPTSSDRTRRIPHGAYSKLLDAAHAFATQESSVDSALMQNPAPFLRCAEVDEEMQRERHVDEQNFRSWLDNVISERQMHKSRPPMDPIVQYLLEEPRSAIV